MIAATCAASPQVSRLSGDLIDGGVKAKGRHPTKSHSPIRYRASHPGCSVCVVDCERS
jgi:hypothetical protein